uniref:Uncharacterized protein n=1 Tax=Micrurus spixii TaxID=129469 RepID=A0A2D4MMU7_9SAUR
MKSTHPQVAKVEKHYFKWRKFQFRIRKRTRVLSQSGNLINFNANTSRQYQSDEGKPTILAVVPPRSLVKQERKTAEWTSKYGGGISFEIRDWNTSVQMAR